MTAIRKYPGDFPEDMRHRCPSCGRPGEYFPVGDSMACQCGARYRPTDRERSFALGFAKARWPRDGMMECAGADEPNGEDNGPGVR